MMPINHVALDLYLETLLAERAEAGLRWFVDDALSRPGTGLLHSGNPNQSSAAGEYPAAQTEALKRSFDARPVGRLAYALGSFEDKDAEGYGHMVQLESNPPEKGGRYPIEKAIAEGELATVLLTGKP